MVLVANDEDCENQGDLIMAAEHVDTDAMTFFLRYGSGIVCTNVARRSRHAQAEPDGACQL